MILKDFLQLYKPIENCGCDYEIWLFIVGEGNYTEGLPLPKKYLNYEVKSFIAVGKNLINITIEPQHQPKQLTIFDF